MVFHIEKLSRLLGPYIGPDRPVWKNVESTKRSWVGEGARFIAGAAAVAADVTHVEDIVTISLQVGRNGPADKRLAA